MPKVVAALAIAGWLMAAPAAAQVPSGARTDTLAALDLPTAVADAVVDFFNDPRRLRYTGPIRFEADQVVRQDIAVLEGPVEIAGRIEGSIVVVNGDLRLFPGAAVTGDILVVGGTISGLDAARVEGEIQAFTRPLDYRREGERILRIPRRPGSPDDPEGGDPRWGSGDFLITTGKSYNRVEGMPITFGPRVETAGRNPLRVHALAVYRTDSGLTLDTDRMGYYLRGEKFLGGERALSVGLAAHSLVEPIEEWHLSDLENGLATFVLHQDYRDHYERQGVSALVAYRPARNPLSLVVEGRWEEHGTLGVGNPWTLFDNAERWRSQPLVAGGELGSVVLQVGYDTRSSAPDPATGWHLRGRVERAFHAELTMPASFSDPVAGVADPVSGERYGPFTAGLVDLRRYNRVNPESRLNFRLLVGGTMDGSRLPPQRQHALGGEGSLPGYELFSLSCGARDRLVYLEAEAGAAPFYPGYGCDAFGLLQAEFRGKLDFRLRLDAAPWEDDEEEGWGWGWDMAPDWTVFVDAGRGWALRDRPDTELRVDAGVGLLVDRLGIFVARPLSGGEGLNLFVRLGPRF